MCLKYKKYVATASETEYYANFCVEFLASQTIS